MKSLVKRGYGLVLKAYHVLHQRGLVGGTLAIGRSALRRFRSWRSAPALVSPPFENEAQQQVARRLYQEKLQAFRYWPLISVVVPTYNTPLPLLKAAIDSVERQLYPNWELCVVDDCSSDEGVRDSLLRAARSNPKIRLCFRSANGNISAATNDGIDMAVGDYVALLDHDDELTEDALFHMVRLLNDKPETDIIYSDLDKIDLAGVRSEPFFKPAWSPEYFRAVMYVGHLLIVRRSLLLQVGGCADRYNNVQDFELTLRLVERTSRIEHIPRILYHWRRVPGSIAADANAKPNVEELQERAVQEHLDRLRLPGRAIQLGNHRVRVVPRPRSTRPLVSILIPTRDKPELIGRCLQSLYGKATYPDFEVIVGDNDTRDREALAILQRHPIRRLSLPGNFHFSRFTNAMAQEARGDYLVLLNNDTEVLHGDWLEHLLYYAEQPDVGAVGPLLLYGNGNVQHAGVILGPRGTADHVVRGIPADSDGYAGSLRCTREVSAITGACLMVSKDKYAECGGLNERFVRHYEDVDFCLRLRARGWRNVYVASTALIHHESMTRGSVYDFTDRILLLDYWEPEILRGDPYYNRNFDPNRFDYSVRCGGVPA